MPRILELFHCAVSAEDDQVRFERCNRFDVRLEAGQFVREFECFGREVREVVDGDQQLAGTDREQRLGVRRTQATRSVAGIVRLEPFLIGVLFRCFGVDGCFFRSSIVVGRFFVHVHVRVGVDVFGHVDGRLGGSGVLDRSRVVGLASARSSDEGQSGDEADQCAGGTSFR